MIHFDEGLSTVQLEHLVQQAKENYQRCLAATILAEGGLRQIGGYAIT